MTSQASANALISSESTTLHPDFSIQQAYNNASQFFQLLPEYFRPTGRRFDTQMSDISPKKLIEVYESVHRCSSDYYHSILEFLRSQQPLKVSLFGDRDNRDWFAFMQTSTFTLKLPGVIQEARNFREWLETQMQSGSVSELDLAIMGIHIDHFERNNLRTPGWLEGQLSVFHVATLIDHETTTPQVNTTTEDYQKRDSPPLRVKDLWRSMKTIEFAANENSVLVSILANTVNPQNSAGASSSEEELLPAEGEDFEKSIAQIEATSASFAEYAQNDTDNLLKTLEQHRKLDDTEGNDLNVSLFLATVKAMEQHVRGNKEVLDEYVKDLRDKGYL